MKRWAKNAIKGDFNPPVAAIRRFCGLPMGLVTLPTVIENASE